MRKIAPLLLLAASFAPPGCGSHSYLAGSINGTWYANLASESELAFLDFVFVTTLTVNSDGILSTSDFNFQTNNTSCIFTAPTESGSFTVAGNLNGQVSGTFQYVVTSTEGPINTLTLNGTESGGTIRGNWTVSGASSGCSANGIFTMMPQVAV